MSEPDLILLRHRASEAVELLLTLLDALDGDPDFEMTATETRGLGFACDPSFDDDEDGRDADAVAIEEACAAHGIVVLKSQPGAGRFKPRETMAVAAIGALVKRYSAVAALALRALAEADLAPIQANHIKAAEILLTDPEFGAPDPGDITKAIVAVGDAGEKEAKLFAATHCVPVWRGLAAVWFKKMPKRRKPSPSTAEPSAPDPSNSKGAGTPSEPHPGGTEARIEPLKRGTDARSEPGNPADACRRLPGDGASEPARAPRAALDDMKVDARSPKGAWAPGRHIRRCSSCDCRFQGAISARECADCAHGGPSA